MRIKYSGRALAALLCVAALAILIFAQVAEAKRFGGGMSFGSRPSFSKSFSKPVSPGSGLSRTPGSTGTSSRGFARPGLMGGMFGGLLMGGLLGSMFFGGPFHGINFMDMLLIGLVIFFVMRLFRGARPMQRQSQQYQRPSPSSAGDPWGTLRSEPTHEADTGSAETAGPAPEGFDSEEFLKGAKMVYTRLQESWAERDLDDIATFTSPSVYDEIKRQCDADPDPLPVEVMMVNARLLEVKEDPPGTLLATVYYDVLMREDKRISMPQQIREVWHFSRPAEDEDAMWRLEGIQQLQ